MPSHAQKQPCRAACGACVRLFSSLHVSSRVGLDARLIGGHSREIDHDLVCRWSRQLEQRHCPGLGSGLSCSYVSCFLVFPLEVLQSSSRLAAVCTIACSKSRSRISKILVLGRVQSYPRACRPGHHCFVLFLYFPTLPLLLSYIIVHLFAIFIMEASLPASKCNNLNMRIIDFWAICLVRVIHRATTVYALCLLSLNQAAELCSCSNTVRQHVDCLWVCCFAVPTCQFSLHVNGFSRSLD